MLSRKFLFRSPILCWAINPVDKIERAKSIKKKYFLRSKDHNDPRVRVVKTLRDKVSFQRLNFMDNTYQVNDQFDIIFCRNALIYFERENQEMVINKLCQKLKPEGFFLLGHSESITNMNVPLKSIKPTIFKKT
ncbi:MAG TPA: hypothetical protein DEQ03_14440 [Marinilabiliales bacterium]|nr:hypothetical protein [Marinilabiliales bacterium]